MHKNNGHQKRYLIEIQGIVQGVGYRPYVYNLAYEHNIMGFVSNKGSSLLVDLEGTKDNIKSFLLMMLKQPPKLARIKNIKIVELQRMGYTNFTIRESNKGENEIKFIAEDVATCSQCERELFDPSNLRYFYPFTNCTCCGPRYSIMTQLPYDRVHTTMEPFIMCPICKKEYIDPHNRRFHAQTNCCPQCGPMLSLFQADGKELENIEYKESLDFNSSIIFQVIQLIKSGKIIAMKGIGGFHLVCDGGNEEAIRCLRVRKRRPDKPFAIMVKDIKTAKQIAKVSQEEENLLINNKRPIVLLDKIKTNIIPDIIAPNTNKIGVMLPYTPLHYLLLEQGTPILVMTSGNLSGGPIQYENNNAFQHLKNITDYFLVHNRQIQIPVEDSVVKIFEENQIIIRNGRGYSPITYNLKLKNQILALGSIQKSTFCVSQNGYGYMSQYLGNLDDYESYKGFVKAVDNLLGIIEATPQIVAYDLQGASLLSLMSNYAKLTKIPIQHHHAHMVSCMVEHHLYEPVIGIIYDGTGLGTDGTIWGGEFLVGGRSEYKRVGHLRQVTIQGGDQSIKEPWRIALSYLYSMKLPSYQTFTGVKLDTIDLVIQALEKNINCYQTSSMGRLFDCVAVLLGIRNYITYDAQAAIELESIIDTSIEDYYEYTIDEADTELLIDYSRILKGILRDLDDEILPSIIATKFHNTIGQVTLAMVSRVSIVYGIKKVVLSGGVFQNEYLLKYILENLRKINYMVYYNQTIPINDSGISVGQIAIADALGG